MTHHFTKLVRLPVYLQYFHLSALAHAPLLACEVPRQASVLLVEVAP